MLSVQKILLTSLIALFVCCPAQAMAPRVSPILKPLTSDPRAVVYTRTYEANNTTYYYECVIIPHKGYDTHIERCTNTETGKFECRETKINHKDIPMQKMLSLGKIPPLPIAIPLEEGFHEGTLVKVPDGYMSIEDLAVGDVIIDMEGKPTEITAISKRYINEYIEIFLPDEVICAGRDQRLYSTQDSSWIKARDLLSETKIISEPANLYTLTTGSHSLCVTPHDISAHNGEAFVLGASALNFGYIAVANPVVLLGGASAALAVVAYNAHQDYVKKHADKNESFFATIPSTIALADRFYYESRKKDLEKAKHELLIIKNDLERIGTTCSGKFTSQFLPQHTYDPIKKIQPLSIAQEEKLSDKQKTQLRESRETELALLEKQIQGIQLLLALHVNQVISNTEAIKSSLNDALLKTENSIDTWNANKNTTSAKTILTLYNRHLLLEYLLCDFDQTLNELVGVTNYYQNCKNVCIRECTNIIPTLEHFASKATAIKQLFAQAQGTIHNNIVSTEQQCTENNLSSIAFKNEAKKNFEKQKKAYIDQVLKNAQTKLIGTSFPGGPKKDNEKEKFFSKIDIYEKNASHIFRNEPGHFPIDTLESRKLLIDMASDSRNCLGKCKYGNEWYGKILDNGQQVWASVRNGFIRNGGINEFPHSFNYETGLCRLTKMR